MPDIIEPHPDFCGLTEAEINKALADTKPGNPIAGEVARLIEGYAANIAEFLARRPAVPEALLRVAPRTAIEAIAMRLAIQTVQECLDGRCRP